MIGVGLCAVIALIATFGHFEDRRVRRPRSRPRDDHAHHDHAHHDHAHHDHVRDVPDFLDIVTLGLSCGSSVPESLALAARHGPPSIAHRLGPVLGAIDARVAFRSALGAADLDPGDAVAVILDVLQQGHQEGDAVTGRLEHLSVDYRRIALSRDQAAARRLSVRILFPMVLCMLPAFALLTIVPLLVASLNSI